MADELDDLRETLSEVVQRLRRLETRVAEIERATAGLAARAPTVDEAHPI